MRRLVSCTLGLAVAMAMAPLTSHAEHCSNTVIYQGGDTGQPSPLGGPLRRGVWKGYVGCTADPNDESFNTNEIDPVLPTLIVAYLASAPAQQLTGTFTFGGQTTNLTFQSLNSRLESESIPTPTGTGDALIVISLDADPNDAVPPEKLERVVYHKRA